MERPDQLQKRLNNIEAVGPILAGLRTLSSGTRLRALSQAKRVDQHLLELIRLLQLVVPYLPAEIRSAPPPGPDTASVLLVIGSEHGLCGAFNESMVAFGAKLLKDHAEPAHVDLWVLGTRLQRSFHQRHIVPLWSGPLSLSSLPSPDLATHLATRWLQSYESRELDSVVVAYNAYRGLASYEPRQVQLLPPQLPELARVDLDWPPVVETDPTSLFAQTVALWLSATLYAILLESAAAEHAARYRILDGAVQNASRLTDELRLLLQTARQDGITAELQDLASGAGLLG